MKKLTLLILILLAGGIVSILPALAYQTAPSAISPNGTSPATQISKTAQMPITSSYNWSGYVSSGGTSYAGVGATWTIPTATNNTGYIAADATWVGIGGVNSQDLIQTGTQSITSPAGDVSYQAWVEKLPGSSRSVPLTVNAGDSITASITQSGSDRWTLSLKDNTTGQSFTTTTTYSSSMSSAEWIQEMPSLGYAFIPLDSFGSVQFNSAWTIMDGKNLTLSESGATPMNMTSFNQQVLATASPISSDGSGFTVTRSDVAVADPSFTFGGRGRGFRITIGF